MAAIEIPGYRLLRPLSRRTDDDHNPVTVVYLAEQQSLHRQVALKVLDMSRLQDAQQRDRILHQFDKQSRRVAQFNHPQVVTIFDIGTSGQYRYFSMELFSGGTLSERIATGWSVAQALCAADALARALGYLHQYGVVYDNLLPDEVLLHRSGKPVLCRFARALWADEVPDLASLTGLPRAAYLRPQRAAGAALTVDAEDDLYALGVLLQQMLTGVLPYRGTDAYQLALRRALELPPRLPIELADYQTLVDGLLGIGAAPRLDSTLAFLDALRMTASWLYDDDGELIAANDAAEAAAAAADATTHIGTSTNAADSISAVASRDESESGAAQRADATPAASRMKRLMIAAMVSVGILLLVVTRLPEQRITVPPASLPQLDATPATDLPSTGLSLSPTDLQRRADRQWQLGQRLTPHGDNAFESYRRLLSLQPGNAHARQRLIEIGRYSLLQRYHREVRALAERGDRNAALRKLQIALRIAPDHAELLALQVLLRGGNL